VKVIAQRVYREPAVFIGLVASVVLALLAVLSGAEWDAQTIVGIAAPFVSALGIRPLVTPTAKVDEQLETLTRPGP
jgi:membrane protein implicated in regulation of membrane protease activity